MWTDPVVAPTSAAAVAPKQSACADVAIIGLGYIGLPTAALLAASGQQVVGVDVSPQVVDDLNSGRCHIVEPDIDVLIQKAVMDGNLRAYTQPQPAQVFVLAVPTPLTDGHRPDLSYLWAAAESVAPVLQPGNLVIIESTSPVGTTDRLAQCLAQARPDLSFPQQAGEYADICLAYCPERVLPGRILQELRRNDRVVGGLTPRCSQAAAAFYRRFVQGECIQTTARTAELCKLAENSFRDVNIAFANELSMICDAQDIDVWELIRLANRHPRVNILQPGCGVGGHCIAVDPWFIVDGAPDTAHLIRTARQVNDSKPAWVLAKTQAALTTLATQGVPPQQARIACLGISFKPDIDDLRESPALQITESLARLYPKAIGVVEPHIAQLPETLMRYGARLLDVETALAWAHILILLVDHSAFLSLQPKAGPLQTIIDTRGVWKTHHE